MNKKPPHQESLQGVATKVNSCNDVVLTHLLNPNTSVHCPYTRPPTGRILGGRGGGGGLLAPVTFSGLGIVAAIAFTSA